MTIPANKRHVTFFCGYGGSCSGAKAAGLECAIAIDNNDRHKVALVPHDEDDKSWMAGEEGKDWIWEERIPAIQTREKNFKDGAGRVMDVGDFKPGPEHAARFVTASPPCKRFSTSAETWDEDDDFLAELDKSIKDLGLTAIEKAIAVPEMEYYVMENVVGLLSKSNRDYLAQMVAKLRGYGFSVEWQVYNSHNFGVCQMRERLLLVASKSGRKNLLPIAPRGIKKKIFKDIMEDGKTKESKARIKDSLWSQSTYLAFVAKMMRGAGQMRIVIPSRDDATALGWEPMALNAFAHVDVLPTIACNAGGGPTRKKWAVLPFSGHGYRNATLLEGLRAQGHDDAWLDNLPTSKSLAWTMVGNAVPKCFMQAVMSHLIDLDKYHDGTGPMPDNCMPLEEAEKIKLTKDAFKRQEESQHIKPVFCCETE